MQAASVHVVAAELRSRVPGLTQLKLHKLLYYCQGHHLATFGEPLFPERVSAWDKGPVVGTLWHAEREGDVPPTDQPELGESALNTIGYVLSRYGALSGRDLINLTHNELPWLRADAGRAPGASTPIPTEWMRDYFRDEPADEGEVVLDPREVSAWLADAESHLSDPAQADDPRDMAARIDTLRAARERRGTG